MKAQAKNAVAPLTADELQQLKWLLGGLLTLISVATVLYLDIAAWTLMALTTVGIGAVVLWPWLPGRIPRWGHRLAFPLIVAVFTGDLWLTGELLPSLVRLDLLLLLYRGITYRQKRDDLQSVVLGLFLIVVAGVLTVSLTFAVHILVFTAGALALLLVITLADASVGASPPASTPEWTRSVHWARLLRRVWQVTDWRVVAMGAVLFSGLVALSALLFVAMPRFQLENSLFLERFITKKARTGFSDTIRFGDVTEITQDKSVALSVDVSDRRQIRDRPYWRMVVLDEYQDGAFRVSGAFRRDSFSAEHHGRDVTGTQKGTMEESATWTFYLESGVGRYLPLLGSFRQLRFREPQTFRTVPAVPIVALRDDPVTMLAYRVEGMLSESSVADVFFALRFAQRGQRPQAAREFMLNLQMEEQDRAVLARIRDEIVGRLPVSAREFSERGSAWLKRKHRYSMRPSVPAGTGDPLVRWMNSEEGGHCELFAGALVVLARSAGFPARIVTGFRGGSWNGYSNNFTLRNSDAHAWVEIFDVKTRSWLRADPTPGLESGDPLETNGDTMLARRNDRSWTARLESLRVFWYRQIVNFDQRSQVDTLNAVKDAAENSSRRLRVALDEWSDKIRSWFLTPWDGRRVVALLGIVAGMVVVGIVSIRVYRLWRFGTRTGDRGGSGDRVRAEAGRWLLRFNDRRLQNSNSAERQEVVRDLQRIRFGMRETWSDAVPVLRRAKRVWRAEKKQSRGRGR